MRGLDSPQSNYWRNKISATTVNLAAGNAVTEIEVFEVKMNHRGLDESALMQIEHEIPYHILFLLEYENLYQAWIGYKEEAASGTAVFKVNRYFHTEWLPEQELPIKLEGLTIDATYEKFVRQIAGDVLRFEEETAESLKESVERDNKRRGLVKQIAVLQMKVHGEEQLNKQVRLNAELKNLKKELEKL